MITTDVTGYNLPASFRWPTVADYSQATTEAYAGIGFDSGFSRALLAPPLQSQVNALVVTMEAVTGAQIDALAAALGSTGAQVGAYAGEVANLTYAISVGDVSLTVDAALKLAGDLASDLALETGSALVADIAAVLPLLSIAVGAVTFAIDYFEGQLSDEEIAEAVAKTTQEVDRELAQNCPVQVQVHRPTGTTADGPNPADLFRGLMVAAELGRPPPPTLASLYMMLCGAETQGVGMTRREWERFDGPARNRSGATGIDPYTQRRMWSLIKAIMRSARLPEPYGQKEFQIWGDGGSAAMATLSELVRSQFASGALNDAYCVELEGPLGALWQASKQAVVSTGWDSHYYRVAAACGHRLGLTGLLRSSRVKWEGTLAEYFCVAEDKDHPRLPGQPCAWRATATPEQVAALRGGQGPTFKIGLTADVSADLIGAALKSEKPPAKAGGSAVPLAVGAAAIGAALWGLKGLAK
jgi:hypothetical protein